MTTPTRVPIRLRDRISVYLAFFWLGIPVLLFWVYIHGGAVDMICDCVPGGFFTKWAPESRVIGGVVTLAAMLFADWYLWVRWRSYRREKKWSKKYADEHAPWYAKKDGKP